MSGCQMDDTVTLVGLDFGTTTSSAAIASAKLTCNAVTGRMELSGIESCSYPDKVFTPFSGDQLDETKLAGYLDRKTASQAIREYRAELVASKP